jgi:acyl-CoA synthetase (AMP-forming)/AMP-acid ligase II
VNVAELLVARATQHPDASAFIEQSGKRTRSISFRALDERSWRGARLLADTGVGAGDHVLLFLPLSIDLYVALIATMRLGAVAMFLDPSAGGDHIDRCCEMVPPSALIATSKAHLLRVTSARLRRIPRAFAVGWPVPWTRRWTPESERDTTSLMTPRSDDDPALLTFTSGSTGRPKAAIRSHGLLAAQYAALQRAVDLAPGEIDLATLPIVVLANLASGMTTVIPDADLRRPGEVDAGPILRQIEEHRVTRAVASPAFFERLLAAPEARRALAHVRRVYTGGAPVFPRLLDALQRAMPEARIVAVYGSTEAEPIAHVAVDAMATEDADAMDTGGGLLVGAPVPDIALRIVPNHFGTPLAPMTRAALEQLALGPREPGEILVHGAHVLRGYLHGAGDEETKVRVGEEIWHRTGDAGYLDAHGRLWLLGRADAAINDDRGRLYPFAVECAASRITLVRRSALIQHDGRRLLIVELTSREVADPAAAIRDALAWARIDAVIPVARLPVDARHNAKIDYPALRRLLSSARAP